jgi:hypothetical protein
MNPSRRLPPQRRHARGHILSVPVRIVLGSVLVAGGGLATIASSPPAAAGGQTFTLIERAPATVLYGTPAQVSLTAQGISSTGYNLSFEDVLPAGVSYVAGSTSGRRAHGFDRRAGDG